jgi:hypothetical protein
MNFFKLQPILLKAFQSLAGKGSPPTFSLQNICRSDKEQTLKLFRWILSFQKGAWISPEVAWAKRIGASANPINGDTIASIAQRFGLNGEPFAAFRNAGINLPDSPQAALRALFCAAEKRAPGEIAFVYDVQSEAELKEINAIVANSQSAKSIAVIVKGLEMVRHFRVRFDHIRVTTALKSRTNQIFQDADDSLNRILRKLELRDRQEQNRIAIAAKEAAAEFERKIKSAEDRIDAMVQLTKNRAPDTLDGIDGRIKSLTMTEAAESLQIVESDDSGPTERKIGLRQKFAEANEKVMQRRSELQALIVSRQSQARMRHQTLRKQIHANLTRIERTIDSRTGIFEIRVELLQSQVQPLLDERFRIQNEGTTAENDLRANRIHDFEASGTFETEIVRLQRKIHTALEEEREIERRHKHFHSLLESKQSLFKSAESKIQRCNFDHLESARLAKSSLGSTWKRIVANPREVDIAWEELIAMRSFPSAPIDDFHCRQVRLITLYDNTLQRINEAIVRMEGEHIALFLSELTSFRSTFNAATAEFAVLPIDPRSRLNPLSRLAFVLSWKSCIVRREYGKLQRLSLDQRISSSDRQSMTMIDSTVVQYDHEASLIRGTLWAIDRFPSFLRSIQSEIETLKRRANFMLHAVTRKENLQTYELFVTNGECSVGYLWIIGRLAIWCSNAHHIDSQHIMPTVIRLRDEYNEGLKQALSTLNSRTPPSPGESSEESPLLGL